MSAWNQLERVLQLLVVLWGDLPPEISPGKWFYWLLWQQFLLSHVHNVMGICGCGLTNLIAWSLEGFNCSLSTKSYKC